MTTPASGPPASGSPASVEDLARAVHAVTGQLARHPDPAAPGVPVVRVPDALSEALFTLETPVRAIAARARADGRAETAAELDMALAALRQASQQLNVAAHPDHL